MKIHINNVSFLGLLSLLVCLDMQLALGQYATYRLSSLCFAFGIIIASSFN